jgi:hypothetical protein
MNDTPPESTAIANDELLLWIHENMPEFTSPKTEYLPLLSVLAKPDGALFTRFINRKSGGLAPGVYRTNEFKFGLQRDGTGLSLTVPAGGEQLMCYRLWRHQPEFCLGHNGPNAAIHSYEVPLIKNQTSIASDGRKIKERSIDLLGSSSEGLPIIIEAKHSKQPNSTTAVSQLFAQFIQGLCYAVTLRYTWSQSPSFREEWSKLPTPNNLYNEVPDTLGEVPIILAADPGYWAKTFHWGDKQEHWNDLCTLIKVAHNAGYPIYVGLIGKPVSPNTQWQFQVVAWDSLPIPTTNGPIQFPTVATS